MSPYLLFGFFIAGLLSVWISPAQVQRHLGDRGMWPVVKASLFGVPLPLCSCGVIPVTMSLYKHGAGRGAAISFLLSTPQTGVDSIFVTYSLLGPFSAILRPIAAFVTGLIGGGLVNLAEGGKESGAREHPTCNDDCCTKGNTVPKWKRALRHGFVTLPTDIGRAMLGGLVIAALISMWVPEDFFATYLAAGSGVAAMLVMMAVGIPVYVCATASVPVAAALIAKGLSPGAALVFLMTGPATNAAALTTLWSVLGKRTAIVYLLTVAGTSLSAGMLVDLFLKGKDVSEMICAHGGMLPGWVQNFSAVVLLAVLGAGVYRKTFLKAD
jgi:uncharacterized membrane protein YraQ (UPF0718 family)